MPGIRKLNKLFRKKAKDLVYANMYRWFSNHEESLVSYMKSIDNDLWNETSDYAEELTRRGTEELKSRAIKVGLPDQGVGGGAEWALLYFLVRYRKPLIMVETGVAMGWSSRAILDAMVINGFGHLYSIDLPYSQRPGREDVGVSASDVGCLVPENRKGRWTLYLGPDRQYLPQILAEADGVDILHYDSDKTYEGRQWAIEQVIDKMNPGSIIIMDDIKDNAFFRNYAQNTSRKWRILREESSERWIGMVDIE